METKGPARKARIAWHSDRRTFSRRELSAFRAFPALRQSSRYAPQTFSEFEEAVEYDELSTFLRLNETWDEELDGERPVQVHPVGVPGASSPSQMTNHKPSFAASPSPLKSKSKGQSDAEFDVGTELVGFGLQGVKVTDDELQKLVADLGLGGAEADDLVKGLGGGGSDEKVASNSQGGEKKADLVEESKEELEVKKGDEKTQTVEANEEVEKPATPKKDSKDEGKDAPIEGMDGKETTSATEA